MKITSSVRGVRRREVYNGWHQLTTEVGLCVRLEVWWLINIDWLAIASEWVWRGRSHMHFREAFQCRSLSCILAIGSVLSLKANQTCLSGRRGGSKGRKESEPNWPEKKSIDTQVELELLNNNKKELCKLKKTKKTQFHVLCALRCQSSDLLFGFLTLSQFDQDTLKWIISGFTIHPTPINSYSLLQLV